MESKQTVIQRLLARFRPVAKVRKKGVTLQAKPKAATPKPKQVRKPKKRIVSKVTALANSRAAEVEALLKKDPSAALKLAIKFEAMEKRERAERVRIKKMSTLEKQREAERFKAIKKATESLTASLPKPSEIGLNVNWSPAVLLTRIVGACFQSSLDNDTLWKAGENGSSLSVKIGAVTYGKFTAKERALIQAAAERAYSWSGMGKSLNNHKGEAPKDWEFTKALGMAARSYEVSQRSLKPSEYYLDRLVEKASKAPLKFTKSTAGRTEAMAALALATAELAISLGFRKTKARGVVVDCSDNRFGTSELTTEILLPYFQAIIDGSKVAGKLKSTKDAANLLTGTVAHLPL